VKPYYQDSAVTIYHGDCREILPKLNPADLVFTSPPYWQQRKYELESFDWIESVAKVIPKINDSGTTQILVNLGQIHINGELFPYWNYLISEMKTSQWKWFGQYTWDQGDGLPGNWHGRLSPSFEYLFHFNRNPVVLNKWIPTNRRGPSGTGLREFDGKSKGISSPKKCGQEFKIPDNVIRVYREMKRVWDHPAMFPETLPLFIIKTFPGDTVLDPFMGSGTTLRAAKDLNRKATGIEISEKYCEIAANRMCQEVLELKP